MRFKQIRQLLKESEILNEVNMSPSALQSWAKSSDAEGIRAGFEAECIFSGLGGFDEENNEPDYDADERAYSISQVIEFFENDDYGYGLSERQADRLRDGLDESYYEWYDNQMFDAFRDEQDDLVREILLEDRPMVERIHDALTEGQDFSDEEADRIIAAGEKAPRFTRLDDQEIYAEENPDYEAYLKASEDANAILDEDVEASISSQDSIYDTALDRFRDNFQLDDDSGFFNDVGLRWMSDIANEFNLDWPVWTSSGGPDGSFDYDNASELAKNLATELGVKTKVSHGYHSARRDNETWIFEPDSSLDADESDNMPVEIISPPMPLGECLDKLEKFVQWAVANGGYSNSSTGFHVGVSLPFKGGKVDFIKLAIFLGDERVLKNFGRESNHFCESAMKKIRGKLSAEHNKGQIADAMDMMRGNLIELATRTLKIVSEEGFGKYTSINPKEDYIEFRSAGGSNYLDDSNIDSLINTVLRYSRAMYIAGRPDLERQEYAKKLYKLMAPQGNRDLELFAKYSTGEITAEQLKKEWAEKTLAKDAPETLKKSTWKLYDLTTGRAVKGYEYSNFTKSEALEKAKQDLSPGSSMEGFLKQYDLIDLNANTGRWRVIDRDNEQTLAIISAKNRGEAADQAYDKFHDHPVEYYIEPYVDGIGQPAKLSRRAQLAQRIKQTSPVRGQSNQYEIVDRRTGQTKLQYTANNSDDAHNKYNNWLRNQGMPIDTENYGYRSVSAVQDVDMDVAQNFSDPGQAQRVQNIRDAAPRANFEFYVHDNPDQVFHRMTNATAEEVRAYINQQEQSGMPPGFLRVRTIS